MKARWSVAILVVCSLAAFALLGTRSAPVRLSADEDDVRAVNQAWFKAYKAGDVEGIVALYADDAVLGNPGVPQSRGHDAIHQAYVKDVADAQKAGVTLNPALSTDVGVSGDMAWEWGSFTVTDKSGTTVDKGKYLTVFAKRDGKWTIVRDIWNSDAPPPAAAK